MRRPAQTTLENRETRTKKLANLEAAVNLHMAYYNFCWRPGKMRVTPAMAAGVARSLWRFDDLMSGQGK